MSYSLQKQIGMTILGIALSVASVYAEPSSNELPAVNLKSDYGHALEQGQIGARRNGLVDCGRAAEADLMLAAANPHRWSPSEEIKALLGTSAPEFAPDLKWVNCAPMKLSSLRGKPVFIRFWYRNCPMCEASAPELNALYDAYAKDGLVIIAIHHSKTTRGDTVAEVAEAAKSSGFKFPIALDNSWKTLDKFWTGTKPRTFSSASFLIDQNGVIVWGHDLGRLEKGTPAAASLNNAIDKLIRKGLEKSPLSQSGQAH